MGKMTPESSWPSLTLHHHGAVVPGLGPDEARSCAEKKPSVPTDVQGQGTSGKDV